MEELLETIKKRNSGITLARHEKKAMRARLVLHMREKTNAAESPETEEYRVRRYLLVSNYITRHLAKATIIAIIFTLSGGASIFAAAESALPGNSLYNVKVHVSEELRFAFKNQEEKTNWEIERTKRRFEEATILTMANLLPDDVAQQIQGNIQQHASEAVRRANKAASQDPEFAISAHQQLASTLQAQTTVLESVKKDEDNKSDIDAIVVEAQIQTEIASESEQQVVTSLIFFDTEEENEVSPETKKHAITMFTELSEKQVILQETLAEGKTIIRDTLSREDILASISGKIEITSALLSVVDELIKANLYEESLMFLQDIQQELLEADKVFAALEVIEARNEEQDLKRLADKGENKDVTKKDSLETKENVEVLEEEESTEETDIVIKDSESVN